MKTAFFNRLKLAPTLKKHDFLLVFAPILIWIALVQARPIILKTHCDAAISPCTPQSVLAMDRPSLGIENGPADEYSYFTQNLSGALTATVPAVWNAALFLTGKLTPALALASIGTDLVIFTETTGWNGMITEASRLIAQRPRPYVYGDAERARDPQNYVSFYSGHTSFAAAAGVCLLLILLSRGAPAPLLLLAAMTSQGLVIATAAYRILAGRHFLSDVIAGALLGGLVALIIAHLHRPHEKI